MTAVHHATALLFACALFGCSRDWDGALDPGTSSATALCKDALPGAFELFHTGFDADKLSGQDASVSGVTFESGAAHFQKTSSITFPTNRQSATQRVALMRGSLDFCFRPESDASQALFRLEVEPESDAGDAGEVAAFQLRLLSVGAEEGTKQLELQYPDLDSLVLGANATSLELNEWHRVVVTWNFNPEDGGPPSSQAFLDGVKLPNTKSPPSNGASLKLGDTFIVGNTLAGGQGAQGFLDDFRIYNGPVSP